MTAKELKAQYQREYMKKYRAKNKDKINAYQNQWRAKNKDKVKKYNREYWERKAENVSMEDEVLFLHEDGKSIREIAEIVGKSKSTIHRILNNGTDNGTQ